MSGAFDLRALVRDVIRTTDAVGPDSVAEQVHARIPAKQRDAALVEALVEVARQVLTRERSGPVEPLPGLYESPRPNRSRKVAGIRAHARALRDQVAVGERTWKRLGDCTFDDLQHAAEVRERMAASNANRAAQYRALAEVLGRSGASTVAELSDDQLVAALDDAA